MTYIDGFVCPVHAGVTQDAYREFAAKVAAIMREHGALRIVDAWGDNVPHGEVTDFHRAVAAETGEAIVFSWLEWPDKAARDAGMQRAMEDPRLQALPMPFDGKRLIYGGFAALLDEGASR